MQFKKLQQFSFIGLLTIVSFGFLYIIKDYLMPVFWALVFGIVFYPIQRRLVEKLKYPALASATSIVLIIFIIFVPLFIIGGLVIQESVTLYQQIDATGNGSGVTVNLIDRFGEVTSYLERFGVSEVEAKQKITELAAATTSWLSSQAVSFGQRTFSIGLQFFLMLYVLFFFLKDGDKIRKRFMEILPLGDAKEKRLFSKFSSITRAVIKGTFVVGFVQGLIGAILFMVAGIQGAILWGVLMMLLSVIPAVGAIIIWLPVGIILIATGAIWQGVMVLAGGALIISLIDNILRPILVGKDTEMPDAIILISTLGGLSIFGITGFVIGPVMAGFFIAMWTMFEEEYRDDLAKWG